MRKCPSYASCDGLVENLFAGLLIIGVAALLLFPIAVLIGIVWGHIADFIDTRRTDD